MHYPSLNPSLAATALLIWGLVIHLVCDWLLQNDWMARNKVRPGHAAALIHAGTHALGLGMLFPWRAALALGIVHYLIDLRQGLLAWGRIIQQTSDPENPATLHVLFWRDQVAHILVLAIFAYFLGR